MPKPTKDLHQHHALDSGQPIKGIALVVHGLNLAPHKMDMLCQWLQQHQIESFRLSLRGHRQDSSLPKAERARSSLREFRAVTSEDWLQDITTCWQEASERAKKHDLPLFFVGFSLGGLLGCVAHMNAQIPVTFDRMLLFAPALSLRWYAIFLHPLHRFPKLVLPSGNPKQYRANWGTSIAAYAALDDLFKQFHTDLLNEVQKQRLNQKTLVFIDPKDELISYKKLKQLIQKHALTNWTIQPINQQNPYERTSPKHLIIDEPSVGSVCWQEMCREIEKLIAFE